MTEYVYAGCATLILFIVLLVIGKKRKVPSDYIFLFWMMILFVNVATFIVISRYNYPASKAGRVLVEFSEASVFLHGPVFMFYTLSLTSERLTFSFRQVLHFVPFLISFILLLRGIRNGVGVSNAVRQGFSIVKMVSLLVYTIAVINQLRQHRIRVKSIFSNTESKYLNWLYFLAWGIISVWVISAAGLLSYDFFGIDIPQYGSVAGNLALCGLIFLIGYFGVRQESIFNFIHWNETVVVAEKGTKIMETGLVDLKPKRQKVANEGELELIGAQAEVKEKYHNSGLSKQKSLELFRALTTLMEEQAPYRESELTLFGLAKQLNIHPNQLSQIINQHRKQNFFDYINEQRVKDVKMALLSEKYNNHSFLGIAHEFGFNSKASFNRAFKKFTGITPGEFKRTAQFEQ
jgi:AraC-like DNA-binding protein